MLMSHLISSPNFSASPQSCILYYEGHFLLTFLIWPLMCREVCIVILQKKQPTKKPVFTLTNPQSYKPAEVLDSVLSYI